MRLLTEEFAQIQLVPTLVLALLDMSLTALVITALISTNAQMTLAARMKYATIMMVVICANALPDMN